MRRNCNGFHLAPIQMIDYSTADATAKLHSTYTTYRLTIESITGGASGTNRIVCDVAQLHGLDQSVFQITRVEPNPCAAYSEFDDAELQVGPSHPLAVKAQDVAVTKLNQARKIHCSQRPLLQMIRITSASLQPTQGYVVRLILEVREALASFESETFQVELSVIYSLDRDVPGQTTVSPEVYPSVDPCSMMAEDTSVPFSEGEDHGDDHEVDSDTHFERRLAVASEHQRLSSLPYLAAVFGDHAANGTVFESASLPAWEAPGWGDGWSRGPETWESVEEAQAAGWEPRDGRRGRRLEVSGVSQPPPKEFEDQSLDLPPEFDPRLERTLCFPRGFSRHQGSCGASWAFAATAVASFRECLEALRSHQTRAGVQFFSAQELVSCTYANGCAGGTAAGAFSRFKREGASREICSTYRMRCFVDNTLIAASATERDTDPSCAKTKVNPMAPGALDAPCRCLPRVDHFTKAVECNLLPQCQATKVPHVYYINGTGMHETLQHLERFLMQELVTLGPMYASMLLYADYYDPVCWTGSGIYIHRGGPLIGKRASTLVGWGRDHAGRLYWLLLNSFGNGWQQEGYFKIMRGKTATQMTRYAFFSVGWSRPEEDHSKPQVFNLHHSFLPKAVNEVTASPIIALSAVYMIVSCDTDEEADMMVRVQGEQNSAVKEARDYEFKHSHVLQFDLLDQDILGQKASIEIWATDRSRNTGHFGPYTFHVPNKAVFESTQDSYRRLSTEPTWV